MELIDSLITLAREPEGSAETTGDDIVARKLELLRPACPAGPDAISEYFKPRPRYLGPRPWIRLIEESRE